MAGFKGQRITFEWDGEEIPGVREKGISAAGEAVNVTSDENGSWQTLLDEAGEDAVTISISGVTKSDVLRAAWFSRDRTADVTLTYPNGAVIEGTFFMASYNETGPYNDATTFEAELHSNGEVTYTPAAG